MSSKELLGDLVVTLVKKARRSKDATTENVNSHPSQCVRGDEMPLSRPPSYRTITTEDQLLRLEATTTPSQELEPTETHILDLATSCFPPISPDAVLPPLPKPVLIPRVSPGAQIPFTRAWAPELADHEITREDFVAFIDNLNIVIRPHLAIHVVRLAALAVGFVPYDGADGIAGALEAVAELATIVMAYTRCKKYFRLMNEIYFHPRKLHAKVVSSKRCKDSLDLSFQERCLKYLSQWICELSFEDIPPPSQQTNLLARMAAWEVRHKIAKADKKAKRSRERAWKRHLKGKQLKESRLDRRRVKPLDWILVQNLNEWETARAEKQAKKEKGKRNLSLANYSSNYTFYACGNSRSQ
ncbi:hypothetical protein F5Y06DRAFT_287395 [Hypoxylon sp. FL0890]|nr:hypothetical protein F5Y06DRAFT_287395 [Hypoxylon sp. FL0890]